MIRETHRVLHLDVDLTAPSRRNRIGQSDGLRQGATGIASMLQHDAATVCGRVASLFVRRGLDVPTPWSALLTRVYCRASTQLQSKYSWCIGGARGRGTAAMTRRLEAQRPCRTPELLRDRLSYQASAYDNREAVIPASMQLESPPSALWTLSRTRSPKACTPAASVSSFKSLQAPSLAASVFGRQTAQHRVSSAPSSASVHVALTHAHSDGVRCVPVAPLPLSGHVLPGPMPSSDSYCNSTTARMAHKRFAAPSQSTQPLRYAPC